jgi:hypothetical protein
MENMLYIIGIVDSRMYLTMQEGLTDKVLEIKQPTYETLRYLHQRLSGKDLVNRAEITIDWIFDHRWQGKELQVFLVQSLIQSLDVVFGEDQARMRIGNAAENFSILRRIALNPFRQDKSTKAGVKTRRLLAASDDAYRLNLLFGQAVA